MGGLRGRFAFLRNRFKFDFNVNNLRGLDIRTLNRILKFSLAALVIHFVINLSVSVASLKRDLNLQVKIDKTQSGTSSSKINSFLKSASYYLDKAKEKDIFRKGMKKIMAAAGAINTPSQKITELTQNYRLVGISWSEMPM